MRQLGMCWSDFDSWEHNVIIHFLIAALLINVVISHKMNLSSSAHDVIQRAVVLDKNQTREGHDLSDYYELEWTADQIRANNYKRVRSRLPPSPTAS